MTLDPIAGVEDIPRSLASLHDVLPAPALVRPVEGTVFTVDSKTRIHAHHDATDIGELFAAGLRRSTGYALPVRAAADASDGISLLLGGADPSVGEHGYQVDVSASAVVVRAHRPAGVFAGVQTLRQLLPAAIESDHVQPGPWCIPAGQIVDFPRFGYRGTMLDVARHFFGVPDVKRYLDEIALYKLNHLHLHLSDDQGWRIAIDGWPRLASYGGSTGVGGGPGGHYTQADYREIVEYAARRHITVVPEIDMPGHVNAALASYPELNSNGEAPPLYTGTDVGFSTLCVAKEVTFAFVDDVIGEMAALTPGPYVHIGGDEAYATSSADYATFMSRTQRIVAGHGKTAVAWHQLARANVHDSTVLQYWGTTESDEAVAVAARSGTRLILSPANKAYLDQKYTVDTLLGLSWAGFVDVRDAYDWDPGAHLAGVDPSAVLGVEAPLWAETVATMADIEHLAFPRIAVIAELGWSTPATHDWHAFRRRLSAQYPRWTVMRINSYRSPQLF